ncbi:unnamed protein product [Eruca vesicaria subsp. sativa]|uniref:Uncharacterized protein n=1 Tax=Eruca vesicaria subsp. sativa TaxID=29727 RepID=A0ABC8JQU0_ERUVS|nr:unnamed protein product [Eruca vesicaria subsp. sativa]
MQHKPTALIVDLLSVDALMLDRKFNMLTFIFLSSNARFLALMMYFSTAGKYVIDEHIFKKKLLAVSGCEPLWFEDSLEIFLDPSSQIYKESVPLSLIYSMVDGIIVNIWDDMEPKTLKSLKDPNLLGQIARATIYPLPVDPSKTNHPVLDWLNKQQHESVIYISFGSGDSLSAKHLTELAWGLELSQQRFVWVSIYP